ncbi:hypothetical protein FACS189415_2960 [Bacteroidia bacterium]|nr:hypothetical protein FACS189426_16670 [Bacteroidia bacterium]GHU82469.1 hypothetical protein FACS189415_2960 [Bacteroidia bacterium]
MNILHLSRKWAWISTSVIGTDNQVSSLQDFGDSELSPIRKLKHTVNKVLSLRDKKRKIRENPLNLRYLRAKKK